MDARIYPALIKLFDTVLQSLEQMRPLSIVDDSPDLASAVEARNAYTKTQKYVWTRCSVVLWLIWPRRCYYLSQAYALAKKYAEGLVLAQRGTINLRETRSVMSLYTEDPISSSHTRFYDLSKEALDEQDQQLSELHLQLRKDWLAYNGGAAKVDNAGYKKPLFFNIALNYAECDVDRLLERAGKPPAAPAPIETVQKKADVPEKKVTPPKATDVSYRSVTPEPEIEMPAQNARGGLSSLLGGWWGRN
jgi:signal recognition particle subunit SRP68